MSQAEEIRSTVSQHYAHALAKRSSGGSCCGAPATTEAAPPPSFGCGSPLPFADVTPGQTVVDLGSGAGFDLLQAARQVGPDGHVIGVDMTDAMVEKARAYARAAGLGNVEVRKGLIEALPVESGSVDWVISNCVLNLSPEKDRVFAEIARVLRPGGRISISDIVAEGLPDWVKENATAYCSCVAGAVPESAYVAALTAAGLEDVRVVDRVVYDAGTIASVVREDAPDIPLPSDTVDEMARSIEGQIQSVRIVGRKPGAAPAS